MFDPLLRLDEYEYLVDGCRREAGTARVAHAASRPDDRATERRRLTTYLVGQFMVLGRLFGELRAAWRDGAHMPPAQPSLRDYPLARG